MYPPNWACKAAKIPYFSQLEHIFWTENRRNSISYRFFFDECADMQYSILRIQFIEVLAETLFHFDFRGGRGSHTYIRHAEGTVNFFFFLLEFSANLQIGSVESFILQFAVKDLTFTANRLPSQLFAHSFSRYSSQPVIMMKSIKYSWNWINI